MDLDDGLTLGHGEVPHLLGHGDKISDIHRLQLAFVKALSHADKKSSLQHRHVLVRGMPMRGNLGPIGAAYPQNEGCGFCIHVSRDRREIASLNNRCPFQIAEAHDLVGLCAFLFLLARSRHRERSDCYKYRKVFPHDSLPHKVPLFKRLARFGRPGWRKDTPDWHARQDAPALGCLHARHMPVFLKNRFVEFKLLLKRKCAAQQEILLRGAWIWSRPYFFGKFGSAFTSLICLVWRSLCAAMNRTNSYPSSL